MPTATSRPFRQEPRNSKPPIYSEEFKPQRQSPPQYSEELKPSRQKPPMYSEEFKPTRTKQSRHSEESKGRTRTKHRNSSQPPAYSEELRSTRTKPPTYSEEFIQSTTPLNYGSRQKPKPMCGTDCSKPKKRKPQVIPAQSNSDRQKVAGVKNETMALEKPKYSYQYNPEGNPIGGGFVPISIPYTPTARTARSRTEELTAKESRQSPTNLLGNGNFEILSGGVFPEDETNEIPQGRRVGRTGRTYDNFPFQRQQQRFQQVPFNVQNFQFPAFYPNRHQLPAHPLFFPRGAF